MIHTVELSKQINVDQFNYIKSTLSGFNIIYKNSLWVTYAYKNTGFSKISITIISPKKNSKQQTASQYYMVSFTVNPWRMMDGDGYRSGDLSLNSEMFARGIYYNIYDLLPDLELFPDLRWSLVPSESKLWYMSNTLKARRIDYCFDIKSFCDIYLKLIDKGFIYNHKSLHRNYYSDNHDKYVIEKDEIDDSILDTKNTPEEKEEEKYIYYKCKSYNINIYNKEYALKKTNVVYNPEDDYDFLRIEIQMKKPGLQYLVKSKGLLGRDLRYLADPSVEIKILKDKIEALTGKGYYCTLSHAYSVIDLLKFRPSKKAKMKALLHRINLTGGVGKTLAKIESGEITDLGTLRTAKSYLKDIMDINIDKDNKIHINPLTIPANTVIPTPLIEAGISKQTGPIIPGLTDLIDSYAKDITQIKESGYSLDQTGL